MPRHGLALGAALALALLLLPATARAATQGAVDWSKTWNVSTRGVVHDVRTAAAPRGGLYVAATVRRSDGLDIVLLRYTAGGKRVWTRWYDGPAGHADRVAAIAATGDGGVVLCGSTTVAGGGDDWVVLRYTGAGTRRWAKRLGGVAGRADRAVDVAADGAGNAVVTGTVTRTKTGVDWCTAKFAANGFRRWRTVMSTVGLGDDEPAALALTAAGRIVVAGKLWSHTRGSDAVVAAYTGKGRLVWRRVWQGLGPTTLADVTAGATVAAAGTTRSALAGDDGLVLSIDQDGDLRWSVQMDGGAETPGADTFTAVSLDGGDVIAAGSVTAVGGAGGDAFVARLAAADGSEADRWTRDAGQNDGVLDLAVSGAGDVFAAGRLGSGGASEALLAGLSPALAELWPAPAFVAGAVADRVTLVPGAAYVAGQRGADLFVARVTR